MTSSQKYFCGNAYQEFGKKNIIDLHYFSLQEIIHCMELVTFLFVCFVLSCMNEALDVFFLNFW